MKIAELRELGGLSAADKVEVKKYLSIAAKSVLAETVMDSCIGNDDSGLSKVDYTLRKLNRDMALVLNYTNLEFDKDDFIEEYDWLAESGVLEYIVEQIPEDELWIVQNLLDDEIEQKIDLENSIEALVAKGINALIEKMPTNTQLRNLVKLFGKEFKDFDVEKLQVIGDMAGKLKG